MQIRVLSPAPRFCARLRTPTYSRTASYLLPRRPLLLLPTPVRTLASVANMPGGEYRLKVDSPDLMNGQKVEAEVEGVEGGKVVLLKVNDQLRALGAKCTHYGAPLIKGTLADDGRITCPWHGACFNTDSGDIENAPALDHLTSFPVHVKDGAVYIIGEEAAIKVGKRVPDITCSPVTAAGTEHVVIVGGGSGAIGAIEGLRSKGFKGRVTVLSKEAYLPIDRTKLSKALIPDVAKIQWRDENHFKAGGVDFRIKSEVESVDFDSHKLKLKDGSDVDYSKVLFCTGGTPKMLPMKGFRELKNIFTLRTVSDVQNILEAVSKNNGKKITIVGSSFIGMEVGKCLSANNDVTIIGMESVPLERIMGAKVGKLFQNQLEEVGVKFKLGTTVELAEPSPNDSTKVGAIKLKDGTVECDLCILGVGVAPATEYLKGKVQLKDDSSVEVDEYFRIKGVQDAYAVGDIATYPYFGPGSRGGAMVRVEHWNVAQNSGRQAAAHIAKKIKPTHFIPVFWSALGSQLRYCGATPNGYDDIILNQKDNKTFVAYYTLGDEVVSVASMQSDPIMTQCAELMRRKSMPSKKDIQNGVNPLDVYIPASVRV